ncbi:MAG: hypothetical protein NWQ65_06735 [Crocinitomicaceae bacterium]|nr:hypothetical protein [Crocinitomicaceae bacterium]MDP4868845.1 hypothetical protein [Crocinitomicaceae bacterium]MDP4955762.1 hypothetical protein [Crocinitomicaceae bacterium]
MKFSLILTLTSVFAASLANAQVGIGTQTPSNTAVLELSASDKGVLFPRLTSVQRAAISSPADGLYVFDTNTNSLWVYKSGVWINTIAEATLGDVKSGFQSADHSGWIKLDGRALSSLSTAQQAAAAALGFTVSLPNASAAYLVQNGSSIGSVSGANTVALTQANLPNVSFTGTSNSAGSHAHTVDPAAANTTSNGTHNHTGTTTTNGNHQHTHTDYYYAEHQSGSWGYAGSNHGVDFDNVPWGITGNTSWAGDHNHSFTTADNGAHAHSVDIPSTTSSTASDHSHTVSVASGGSATPVNIAPKSMSVNMFVYLGL